MSAAPLLLMGLFAWGFGHFYWDAAVAAIVHWLTTPGPLDVVWQWMRDWGIEDVAGVLAPLILVVSLTPVLVVLSMLLVAVMMTPALVSLVAQRRFDQLERKKGGSFITSILWSLGSTLLAVLALLVSIPLWLVPPLVLILPPLIWGWLTYRVMAFDALAEHASKDERRALMSQHSACLLAIGVLSGFLGAAPSVLWASGVLLLAAFWLLIPLAIWVYTLVFAFSSLWFSHYCLAALAKLRAQVPGVVDAQLMAPAAVAVDAPSAPALSGPDSKGSS